MLEIVHPFGYCIQLTCKVDPVKVRQAFRTLWDETLRRAAKQLAGYLLAA